MITNKNDKKNMIVFFIFNHNVITSRVTLLIEQQFTQ
jgi:hypothetical protein